MNQTNEDDRFYTPRAQASTSRSTASYGTPRSTVSGSDDNESHRRMMRQDQYPQGNRMVNALNRDPRLLTQSLDELLSRNHKNLQQDNRHTYQSFTDNTKSNDEVFSYARHGRVEELEALLEKGLPTDIRDDNGNTILAIACQNGNKRVVKLALRYGANINSKNTKGNTALHFCYKYGFADSLGAYLISKGADQMIRNADNQICTDLGESYGI